MQRGEASFMMAQVSTEALRGSSGSLLPYLSLVHRDVSFRNAILKRAKNTITGRSRTQSSLSLKRVHAHFLFTSTGPLVAPVPIAALAS